MVSVKLVNHCRIKDGRNVTQQRVGREDCEKITDSIPRRGEKRRKGGRQRMKNMVRGMIRLRGLVVALFLGAAVFCALLTPMVRINYDIVDYLPSNAPSTLGLDLMDEIYDKAVPNVRVMIQDVTIPEAMAYKARLEAVDGVDDVNWLDDQVDITVPLEIQDQKTVADWYRDGDALYSLVVTSEKQIAAVQAIREIIGEDNAMSGSPVETVDAHLSASSDMVKMMSIIVPIIFLILLFTTTSWFEPVLFMLNVGVAIVINMGTNLIFGEICFITNTTGAILQLACSMDYAIFLLERFEELRQEGLDPEEAMAQAVTRSAGSIASSGLTTVMGFAALIAMQFLIGPDMGYVLSKGIAISLATTLMFMPCATMFCYRLIDRTSHRSFMPSFHRLAKATNRVKGVVTIGVAVLLIPCYLAQQNIHFVYGASEMTGPDSQIVRERDAINDRFGESNSFAILVPVGSTAKEQALNDDIKALPQVSSVLSYVETVGRSIPDAYVPPDQLKLLTSGGYTRLVVSARIPSESAGTFRFVEELRAIAESHYPGQYYMVGIPATIYDMKDTITADSVKVNLISIGAIGIILLINFRSVTLPVLLLLTIESSIFINIAVPYFTGTHLQYIGYLIISSVQLGATVDYAILFTNRYLELRRGMPRQEAVTETIRSTAASILTSGGILATAGVVLRFGSSNLIVGQLGVLVARGAILSVVLVLVLLPTLLTRLEWLVKRTTRKLTLYEGSGGAAAVTTAPKEATA